LRSAGELQRAKREALELRRDATRVYGDDPLATWSEQFLLAAIDFNDNDYSAVERWIAPLIAVESNANNSDRIHLAHMRGALARATNKLADAKRWTERAHDLASAPGVPVQLRAHTEIELAHLALTEDDPETALRAYTRATDLLRTFSQGCSPTIGDALMGQGAVHHDQEHLELAISFYEQAIASWKRCGSYNHQHHADTETWLFEARTSLAKRGAATKGSTR
jgi:tetratricopeptide (TPR) repeat protein